MYWSCHKSTYCSALENWIRLRLANAKLRWMKTNPKEQNQPIRSGKSIPPLTNINLAESTCSTHRNSLRCSSIAMAALTYYSPIVARASSFAGRKVARATNGTSNVSMRATWMPGSAPPSYLDGTMPWCGPLPDWICLFGTLCAREITAAHRAPCTFYPRKHWTTQDLVLLFCCPRLAFY